MLTAYPVRGKAKSERLCAAFVKGAPRQAVGHVFYGVDGSNVRDFNIARRSGEPWYYLDNSYFDATRGWRFRATKNRLQVRAGEHWSDGKRFADLNRPIEDWQRNQDGHMLVVEQSEAFLRMMDAGDWLARTVQDLRELGMPLRTRSWSRNKAEQLRSLPDDLKGARSVVTHTSAAAVEAVLRGIPAIVSDEHALAGMVCSDNLALDQRQRFLSVLADHEFTIDELEDGTAWRRLNP